MIKTCSFAASALITLAIVAGFSVPVSAAPVSAPAAPSMVAGCWLLA